MFVRRIPWTELDFGGSVYERKSFTVFEHLRSQASIYSTVIFSSKDSLGYFSLNARHQRLAFNGTRMLLCLDEVQEPKMDIEFLKHEFMTKKSIVFAVRDIYCKLRDVLDLLTWPGRMAQYLSLAPW
jgi:hypothetical protein